MLIDSSKSRPQKIFDFLHAHILVIIVGIVIVSSLLSMVAIITSDDDEKDREDNGIVYEDIDTLYFAMSNIKSLNPFGTGLIVGHTVTPHQQ